MKCKRCGYECTRNQHLIGHLQKITPCKMAEGVEIPREILIEEVMKAMNVPKDASKYSACEWCDVEIHKSNMARHKLTCKSTPGVKKAKELQKLQTQISMLQQEVARMQNDKSDEIALMQQQVAKIQNDRNIQIALIQQQISRMSAIDTEVTSLTSGASTSGTSIIETVVEDNVAPQHEQTIQKQTKKKQNIPNSRRIASWNAHIGVEVGQAKCMCCQENLITQHKFNCGHVISEAHGGTIEVSNLRPICYDCNNDMGSENMKDFAARVHNVIMA
jgi:HNH endonuclease